LIENHDSAAGVWLIKYKKKTNVPTISWSESVDEALCFGWIDGTARPVDGDKFLQYFCKRKRNSNWSKINKEKVVGLIEQGLMTKAGYESIEIAKQNGSWSALDEVEELIVPQELAHAFETNPEVESYYFGLSKSARKYVLLRLVLAKTTATKQKRITEIVALANLASSAKLKS
jgi:uncharacterized protein YdeI (YjbR/CyaY-like superfamily)